MLASFGSELPRWAPIDIGLLKIWSVGVVLAEFRLPEPRLSAWGLSVWGLGQDRAGGGAGKSRWRCKLHGTVSFLPPFIVRYFRTLGEVVRQILDHVVDQGGRLEELPEICGPSADTVRRWVCRLTSPLLQPWFFRNGHQMHDAKPAPTTKAPERSRTLSCARHCAQFLNLDSVAYPILLQSARLAEMTRYQALN